MNIRRVDPDTVRSLLQSDAALVYLDVRTPEEFAGGHVPDAVNVPVAIRGPSGMIPNPDFLLECSARFPKDTPLVTGSMRGGRSIRAAGALLGEGYSNVMDMRGGWEGESDAEGEVVFLGWRGRSFPVDR